MILSLTECSGPRQGRLRSSLSSLSLSRVRWMGELVEQLTCCIMVNSLLVRYNVCVFAYGQTGSGKTFTMEGGEGGDEEVQGMIPRSALKVVKFRWRYWETILYFAGQSSRYLRHSRGWRRRTGSTNFRFVTNIVLLVKKVKYNLVLFRHLSLRSTTRKLEICLLWRRTSSMR